MARFAIPLILLALIAAGMVLWDFRAKNSERLGEGPLANTRAPSDLPVLRRHEPESPKQEDPAPDLGFHESLPWHEPAAEGFLIRSISRATGVAVPGAEVLVAITDRRPRSASATLMHCNTDTAPLAPEVRYRADQDGLVRIELGEAETATLRVVAPGLQGTGTISPDAVHFFSKSLTIELSAVTTISVQVVDSSGRPAIGASLRWGLRPEVHDRFGVERDAPPLSILGRTKTRGPDGIAQIRLTEDLVSAHSRLVIEVLGLFRAPLALSFPTTELPTAIQTLTLPPCGAIDLRFEPRVGEQAPEALAVVVSAHLDRSFAAAATSAWSLEFRETLKSSSMPIPWVETGLQLSFRLDADPLATFNAIEFRTPGPQTPGEVVSVILSPPEEIDRLVLVGRLVTTTGEVLRDQVLSIGWRDLDDRYLMDHLLAQTRTDSQGRFQVGMAMEARFAGQSAAPRFLATLATGESFYCELPPYRYEIGRLALGDVPVELQALLVAGRVTDQNGQPVADVKLELARPESHVGKSRFGATTDARGRYAFHGSSQVHQVRVTLNYNGRSTERRGVLAGATNVDFEVTRLARLKLQVTAEDPAVFAALIVQLADTPGQSQTLGIAADGKVDGQLEPGHYDLRIGPAETPEPLWYQQEGLELIAGETLDLGTITLAAAGKLLKLRFVDVEDRPIDSGRISLLAARLGADEGAMLTGHVLDSRALPLLVPELPIMIEADLAGFRKTRCRIDTTTATIKLQPSLSARLTIVGLGVLPEDVSINLCLRSTAKSSWNQQVTTTIRPGSSSRVVGLPFHGPFEVDCFVVLSPKRGAQVEDILLFDSIPKIEVRAIEVEQEFPIQIDATAFQETVAELRALVSDHPAKPQPRGRERFK